MDEFNAKKSRARKLKQDKYHEKPRKGSHSSAVPKVKNDSKESRGGTLFPRNDKQDKVDDDERQNSGSDDTSKGKTFSKRKLTSNWDRYEEALLSTRTDQDSDEIGAQFEDLLLMPTSGGHLKFKHEQEWEKERSDLQTPWFQFDVKNLEKNLSTVPFFIRQDLPPNLFSESQLQRLKSRAKQNASSLRDIDEGLLKMQLSLSESKKNETVASRKPDQIEAVRDCMNNSNPEPLNITGSHSEEDHDLDDILNLVPESPKKSFETKSEVPTHSMNRGNLGLEDSKIEEKGIESTQASLKSESNPRVLTTPSVSLDDWLDSVLDD